MADGSSAPGLLAARWRRVVGRLVDMVMWSPVIAGLGWLSVLSSFAADSSGATQIALAAFASVATTVLIVTYEVFCTLRFGGTLGKLMVGTAIVTDDQTNLDARRMTLRMAPLIAATLLSVVPVLGPLTGPLALLVLVASVVLLFTDERRQTVWDKTGRTLVVRS